MLHVTEKASEFLNQSLEASRENDDEVLRLVRAGEGLALAISEERDDDQVVEREDRKVLVIEPAISQALDGTVIDAVDTPEGPRLTLQSP